jgi:uncharacterized membrane protein (UPF0127 family)
MPESIILERSGRIVVSDLRRARGWRARCRGLRGRDRLDDGEALLFTYAPHVHTVGMSFPIDVVFCDRAGRVLRVTRELGPGRSGPLVLRARCTIEMGAGKASDIERSDRLIFAST